jgi:hypothetical protein
VGWIRQVDSMCCGGCCQLQRRSGQGDSGSGRGLRQLLSSCGSTSVEIQHSTNTITCAHQLSWNRLRKFTTSFDSLNLLKNCGVISSAGVIYSGKMVEDFNRLSSYHHQHILKPNLRPTNDNDDNNLHTATCSRVAQNGVGGQHDGEEVSGACQLSMHGTITYLALVLRAVQCLWPFCAFSVSLTMPPPDPHSIFDFTSPANVLV